MCLELSKTAKRKTAKKDIVVYKKLNHSGINTSTEINDGDFFKGRIYNIACEGRIHKTAEGVLYFCTNNEEFDGSVSPEKFNYLYSWRMSNNVHSIIVNDVELINTISFQNGYVTPYQNSPVMIGKTYKSNLFKEDKFDFVNIGLHSFKNLEDAKVGLSMNYSVLVKCIIPKGSDYYEGIFNYKKSYASDTLTYVELITNLLWI